MTKKAPHGGRKGDFSMTFWILHACAAALIPVLMLIVGWLMHKHCPRRINSILGYRTAASKKNEETWQFANTYFGKLYERIGLISLIPSVVILLPFLHSSRDVIESMTSTVAILQVALLLLPILQTEKAIRKQFSEEKK